MRSEGSRLLGAVELTREIIAARLRVKHASVSMWISGTRIPNREHREAMRVAFGIPIEAWPPTSPEEAQLRELRACVRQLRSQYEQIRAVVIEEADSQSLERIVARLEDLERG